MATDGTAPDEDLHRTPSAAQRIKRWIFSPRGIVTSGAALAALILALCAAALWADRADAIARGRETSANLITVVDRDIARNVEVYGLSLRAVVDGIQTPGVMALAPALRDKVLFDGTTSVPFIGDVLVIDETGQILIAHGNDNPPAHLAQQDFFVAQARAANTGLFISRPFRASNRDDDWRVAMSRRIEHADGSFAGIAMLTIRLDYFERLLAHLELGANGTATILQSDGTLMARQPYDARQIGRVLPPGKHHWTFRRDPNGSFIAPSSIDGVTRLLTFAHVPGTSLIVSVGLSNDALLNHWRHLSALLGGAILALSAILMLAACWFARALRASLAAQSRLEKLASIDGLTGLLNRRAFDEHITREWKRSIRSGRPLSLLMLDVDHFKAFNDRYGHGRGDLALIAVASAITGALRRPADLAARFGGEEFVIVLPDTDLDGAARVADAVRRAVMSLQIPHALSDHRALTVSIGTSERLQRSESDSFDKLIKRADTALYDAKRQGRNTVSVFTPETREPQECVASSPLRPFDSRAGCVVPC
jgi:diguanylate cyclase (GGDEF)-like protein